MANVAAEGIRSLGVGRGEEAFSDHSPEVSTLASHSHPTRYARWAVLALRATGALALIAMGALHLQQYYDAGYSALPTIGTLFVRELRRRRGRRTWRCCCRSSGSPGRLGALAVPLLAGAGAAMAAASIVFPARQRADPAVRLSGDQHELGAITVALLIESIATAALGARAAVIAAVGAANQRHASPRRVAGRRTSRGEGARAGSTIARAPGPVPPRRATATSSSG